MEHQAEAELLGAPSSGPLSSQISGASWRPIHITAMEVVSTFHMFTCIFANTFLYSFYSLARRAEGDGASLRTTLARDCFLGKFFATVYFPALICCFPFAVPSRPQHIDCTSAVNLLGRGSSPSHHHQQLVSFLLCFCLHHLILFFSPFLAASSIHSFGWW